jgi:hypothetical protein
MVWAQLLRLTILRVLFCGLMATLLLLMQQTTASEFLTLKHEGYRLSLVMAWPLVQVALL